MDTQLGESIVDTQLGESISVVAVCGSLRRDSLNRQLLELARGLDVDGVSIEVWDDRGALPRVAVSRADPFPEVAASLRGRVANADALLIVTPEFNRSLPGYVKDVVDWLGIQAPPRPLAGKVCAVMSTSPDAHGGAFAQLHLTELLRRAGATVVTNLEAAVGNADPGRLAAEDVAAAATDVLERLRAAVVASRVSAA